MKSIVLIISALLLFSCHRDTKKSVQNNITAKDTFPYRKLSATEKEHYAAAVKRKYDSMFGNRLNGGILVAKNGEVLFEDYRGYADIKNKDSITPETPFHLASVSKTFTGMAIMKLWEESKLNLDDSLQVFFPDLPYPGITVRMLLSHRSGLPNYVYFMPADTAWRKKIATNNDMLQFMINKKPARYSYPDRGFHYCNTNYALLALIIEKVTGQPYPQYMADNLFTPLGMKHSYIFSIADTANYHPSYQYNNRPFNIEPMDCIYGDKNVYSTTARYAFVGQSFVQQHLC